MSYRQDGGLAIVAALVVLLTAFIHPIVSTIVSILMLLGYSIYKFRRK